MKRNLAVFALIYVVCIALTSLLWDKPVILTTCIILVTIFMLLRWHSKSDLMIYAAAFVLGPIGEIVAVSFGAWQYAKPLYLIPFWLPFLWGLFGLFLKKLCESLTAN